MGSTVLVVDDDAAILGLLADLFDEEGYRVQCATDGAAALQLVRAEPPDLVLTDDVMPVMGGIALAEELLALRVPTILMSAAGRLAFPPGTTFVAKPFDLDDLLAVVARVLAGCVA